MKSQYFRGNGRERTGERERRTDMNGESRRNSQPDLFIGWFSLLGLFIKTRYLKCLSLSLNIQVFF